MNIPNWVERCTQTIWFVLPFLILIVVWDVQLYSFVFLFVSSGQEWGTPELNQRSISTFLYICLSTYKNRDMCSGLLFNQFTSLSLSLSLSLLAATSFSLLNSSVPFNLTHTLVWNIFYFESIMFDKMLERKLINYISILMTLYFILICYVFFFGNRNN